MKFLPTSKKILKYNFIPAGQRMTPMSYRLSDQDGELIKTITSTDTADKPETKNVALKGDVVMSGPSGETYVVKGAKFGKLYDGNIGGIVYPEQSPRMVAAYTGQQVVNFTAPWGESMILKPGDYLVKDGDAGYYRVAKAEYEQTYNQPGSTGHQGMAEGSNWSDLGQKYDFDSTTDFERWLTNASDQDIMRYVYDQDGGGGTYHTTERWQELKNWQIKLLGGPAAAREKGVNDRLKSKLKKYPNISAPMKEAEQGMAEGDNMSTFVESNELARMLKHAGVPVSEGVLKDDTRNTWDHLLDRFRLEVEQFKQGGKLDDDLYDALYDYYHHHGAMPFKVSKASSDNSRQWVSSQLAKDMGLDENLISPMIMPVSEGSCNMTMEGDYCPEHGLAECGMSSGGAVGMPYSMGEEQVDEFIDPDTVTHAINALNPVTGAVAGATLGKGIEKAADWYKNRQEKKALAKQQQQNGVAEGNDDPINSNSAMTGSYYEGKESKSQEGDALLARIKSLALLR
jgi:hypothetical protein